MARDPVDPLYAQQWGWGETPMNLFGWVFVVFGDPQQVRTLHHLCMWYVLLFVLVHVYMVFREDIMSGGTVFGVMGSGIAAHIFRYAGFALTCHFAYALHVIIATPTSFVESSRARCSSSSHPDRRSPPRLVRARCLPWRSRRSLAKAKTCRQALSFSQNFIFSRPSDQISM